MWRVTWKDAALSAWKRNEKLALENVDLRQKIRPLHPDIERYGLEEG
jgi:hypothetical protein